MGIIHMECYDNITESIKHAERQKEKGGKSMKKRMKRLAALSMAVLMAASMAACGGSGGSSSSGGSGSGSSGSGDDKEIVYWNIGTESPDKDIVTAAVEKFNSETESGYTVTSVSNPE